MIEGIFILPKQHVVHGLGGLDRDAIILFSLPRITVGMRAKRGQILCLNPQTPAPSISLYNAYVPGRPPPPAYLFKSFLGLLVVGFRLEGLQFKVLGP